MLDKTKKIEVCVGCDDHRDYGSVFPQQVDFLFKKISDFRNNGGSYYPISGQFEGKRDLESYKMEFYCIEDMFNPLINKIKEVFRENPPKGVEFVSIKSYNVVSDSFSVLEND